jgi:PCFT/HCP family folate transporter-like MFS transporter 1/3
VCNDLYADENSVALDWVQTHASYWSLYVTMALSLPAILVSSFLGSWSDSLGRKLPMIVPSVGGAASSIVYLAMSLIQEAPIEFIIVCIGIYFVLN